MAFFALFSQLINLKPATVRVENQFAYWESARGYWVNVVIGTVLVISVSLCLLFFIIQGIKYSENTIRKRTVFMTLSLLSLFIAVMINFIIGASEEIFIFSLLAGILFILSGILTLIGTFSKS